MSVLCVFVIGSVAFDPYSKKYEDSWKGDPVPETENRDLRAVASKYFPVKSQGIPASERPKLYIDQLLDKCLHPKKYLYPEECQDRDRMVRLRANGCDFFAKNNLSDHAFLVADCVIQNHTQLEKEQICEKLRPRLLNRETLFLEVARKIASTMPDSPYCLLTQCCTDIQEQNWDAVSKTFPSLTDSWKKDFVPDLMKAEVFDLVVEIAQGFSDLDKQRLCDQLITINTLESLFAAKKIADYSYQGLVQCWIDLKENRLDQVKEELTYLPPLSKQKETLAAALSVAEDVVRSQNPVAELSGSKAKSHKVFLVAACLCVFACIGALFQKIYKP